VRRRSVYPGVRSITNPVLENIVETIMKNILAYATITLLATVMSNASAGVPVVCIAMPKAQLGQGNNSPTDVSEPVRTTLGGYMAGPTVTLARLDARIPIQVDAEAAQKSCTYVLQSSVSQKKAGSAGGFLKKLAPLASMMPMMGAMAAQSVATSSAQAAAQSAQQEAMSVMTDAQQSNVKLVDASEVKPATLKGKATQDGEDLLGPILEQVATAVITKITAA
jgi:hypothetical protein